MSKYQRFLSSVAAAGALLAAVVSVSPARAAVVLTLSDGNNDADGNNFATTVAGITGKNVSFTARVSSTTETISGIDYLLQSSSVPAKPLNIQARDLTAQNTFAASTFSDLTLSDSVVGIPGLVLNPQSGTRTLGGSTNNGQAVSNSTFTIATYTINVPAGTPNGDYTISVVGTGATDKNVTNAPTYLSPATGFSDTPITTTPATYVIHVTPEPASLSLVAGAAALLLTRRRRKTA